MLKRFVYVLRNNEIPLKDYTGLTSGVAFARRQASAITRTPQNIANMTKKRTSQKPLTGRVALVAGATRGAGRGIARALAEAGATVYCTGRSVKGKPSPVRTARNDSRKPRRLSRPLVAPPSRVASITRARTRCKGWF